MIISASRRTDIPAFYSQWFIDCIQKGYCTVTNPFNPNQSKQVSLLPSDIDAIVFWTRYPAPLMKYLDDLNTSGYRYIFLFTITGYPQWLEPHSQELSHTINIFKSLSQAIGPQRIVWRYDPIVFSKELDFDFHINNFNFIASRLSGFTHRVIISIMEPYNKVLRRLKKIKEKEIVLYPLQSFDNSTLQQFFSTLKTIALNNAMSIQSCCSNVIDYGIDNGACIDKTLLADIFGIQLNYKKDPYQRKECLCAKSIDIGSYNTCKFGCLYCYANK
jgi:hypothetical protein